MNGSNYTDYFLKPEQATHRRYEALRAVFVDGESLQDVAQRFGLSYGTIRNWVSEFRRACECTFAGTRSENHHSARWNISFLPLLAQLRFDRIVTAADYPGSKMIPAANALLSMLTLKLLDKERLSHIDDFNCDEALGLFAGLNVLPKKQTSKITSSRCVGKLARAC